MAAPVAPMPPPLQLLQQTTYISQRSNPVAHMYLSTTIQYTFNDRQQFLAFSIPSKLQLDLKQGQQQVDYTIV